MSREILDYNFCNLVFVYGSLQTGCWNNHLLLSSDYMWDDVTEGRFVLTDIGFPYAIPEEVWTEEYIEALEPEFLPVRGEVFRMDSPFTLYKLDRLEGHPHHYYRTPIRINGVTMWMYQQYDQSVILQSELCPIVDGAYEWQKPSSTPVNTAILG